jgi:hypothetical protein
MQTFTQALIEHVLAGRVDREIAANAATNKHDFVVALERALKRQRHEESGGQEAEAALAAEAAAEAAAAPTVAEEGPAGLRIAG